MFNNNPAPDPFLQPESSGRSPLLIILIAILAVGAIFFGLLSVVAFNDAGKAKKALLTARQTAAEAARKDQKQLDATATELASESPFRSYIAPVEYGSFDIRFPKNWSSSVAESRNGSPLIKLTLTPNFIKSVNGIDEKMATRVLLVQDTLDNYIRQYTQTPSLKRKDLTVSGIAAVEFNGSFSDKNIKRLVAVPIRDKVLVFINENEQYAGELNQILAQTRINP